MRKLLLIIMFCICFYANSQIKFSGYTEIGYIGKEIAISIPVNHQYSVVGFNYPDYALYADVVLKFNWKRFTVTQNLSSVFTQTFEDWTFTPHMIEYTSKLDFKITKWLSVGASHYCLHPVVTELHGMQTKFVRGSGDNIYMKITFNGYCE